MIHVLDTTHESHVFLLILYHGPNGVYVHCSFWCNPSVSWSHPKNLHNCELRSFLLILNRVVSYKVVSLVKHVLVSLFFVVLHKFLCYLLIIYSEFLPFWFWPNPIPFRQYLYPSTVQYSPESGIGSPFYLVTPLLVSLLNRLYDKSVVMSST